MLQPEASRIPLLTAADYMRDPHGYDPAQAWEKALRITTGGNSGGEDPRRLRLLTENLQAGSKLDQLARDVLAGRRSVRCLAAYLHSLDEAIYHFRAHMTTTNHNGHLRSDLMPWVDTLADWVHLGKKLLAASNGDAGGEVAALIERCEKHTKCTGGSALKEFAGH
jgi:hyaluronoglucosaminidase